MTLRDFNALLKAVADGLMAMAEGSENIAKNVDDLAKSENQ
jgi:hypothetical protein